MHARCPVTGRHLHAILPMRQLKVELPEHPAAIRPVLDEEARIALLALFRIRHIQVRPSSAGMGLVHRVHKFEILHKSGLYAGHCESTPYTWLSGQGLALHVPLHWITTSQYPVLAYSQASGPSPAGTGRWCTRQSCTRLRQRVQRQLPVKRLPPGALYDCRQGLKGFAHGAPQPPRPQPNGLDRLCQRAHLHMRAQCQRRVASP